MIMATSQSYTVRLAAIIVFIIASLTDGVDGYIARKYNQVTNFGKFIDPLADKLLVCAALLILMGRGDLPAWCVMIIIAREFVITSLRMVAAADGKVIAASIWGKIKTFTQIICVIILLYDMHFWIIPDVINSAGVCVFLMAATALISCFFYVKDNFNVIKDGLTQKGDSK